MRLELVITEKDAILRIVAQTDFEMDTLARAKRDLPIMCASIFVDHIGHPSNNRAREAAVEVTLLPAAPEPETVTCAGPMDDPNFRRCP